MSKYESMRGKTLLLNLNNARIRYSRAREEGTSDVKVLAHEVAYLQSMWRDHIRKMGAAPSEPLCASVNPVTALAA